MGSVQIDRSLPVGIFVVAFGCLVLFIAFAGPGRLRGAIADAQQATGRAINAGTFGHAWQ